MSKPRILSGIKPSNSLTLGNYLGALKHWIPQQDIAECLYCVVDLHAITVPQDPVHLRTQSYELVAAYMACGLDPQKSTLFIQSHVHAHAEMAWILGCLTPLGWLNRMTQFKDKAGKKKDQASAGLYTYPVLMAGDILLYDADEVPVGDDQKQHVELTRDIAQSINHRFGKELLKLPEPVIPKTGARIMSLRDGTKKMSKSDDSDYASIFLLDDSDAVSQKIRKAKTDPEPLPSEAAGLEDRPEAKNLVTIMAALAGTSLDDVLSEYGGKNFSEFKPVLAEAVVETLAPIRSEMVRLLADTGELDKILAKGAHDATAIANRTIQRLKEAVGFLPQLQKTV